MIAIIPCAGAGTRLSPISLVMPKALIPIDGRPMIHYIIKHLESNGIKNIVITVSDVEAKRQFSHALEMRYPACDIAYSIVGRAGTGWGIAKTAWTYPSEEYVVYYGDIITEFDLKAMLAYRKERHADCTLAVTRNKELEFGVVANSDLKEVTKFMEHPTISDVCDYAVNVGIAVCNKEILNLSTRDDADFFGDVIPSLIVRGYKVISYYIDSFIDIGTFTSLVKATERLSKA